ncbi:MAG: 30S ribosomal protein S17 [Chloroflexi bacterium]|nr:30S ribosomal protein S17 [Chloroflexota bacterium]
MGAKRVLMGRVASDKMQKTIVVEVERVSHHPLYHRAVRHRKRYKAHDPGNLCRVGDLVRIAESQPLSKEKRWQVVEVLQSRSRQPQPTPVAQVDVATIEGEGEQ